MAKKFIDDREQIEKLAPISTAPVRKQVFVCTGKSCKAVGSEDVLKEFGERLKGAGLRFGKPEKGRNPQGAVQLAECGSVGFCSIGPAVLVYPDGVWYAQVTPDDVGEIIEKHLVGGEIVERLAVIEKFGGE